MKSTLAIVFLVGVIALGLGSFLTMRPGEASAVIVQAPGKTVLQDDSEDFLLRSCDPVQPQVPCSLPPGAPLSSPAWTDIDVAALTQIGSEIEMSISLQQPIPDAPPWLLSYGWQFENGCLGEALGPVSKDGVGVYWLPDRQRWTAVWYEIVNCSPREIKVGTGVPFSFSEDRKTVRVRLALSDLLREGATESEVLWWAIVRRMRFDDAVFPQTFPVDGAPNVAAFNPNPPPIISKPERPASWVPETVASPAPQ